MSSNAVFVTSFSPEGAKQYGLRCVESLKRYWSGPIVVYLDEPMAIDGVTVRLTSDIPGWIKTRDKLPTRNPYAEKPDNYIWNARKFAVKAFVWDDMDDPRDYEIVVWVDGDTEAISRIPADLPERILGESHLAYLGRGAMHPETGCVVFRTPAALQAIYACCAAYHDGWFAEDTSGWTDCHVLRRAIGDSPFVNAVDLTTGAHDGWWTSTVDAMALSPWGPYLKHYKGSKAKREVACAS